MVLDSISVDGDIVAIPINLHIENKVWCNLNIYKKLELSLPGSMDELLSNAKAIHNEGCYIPLAVGDEPWQNLALFSTILASLDSAEFVTLFSKPGDKSIYSDVVPDAFIILDRFRQYAIQHKQKNGETPSHSLPKIKLLCRSWATGSSANSSTMV